MARAIRPSGPIVGRTKPTSSNSFSTIPSHCSDAHLFYYGSYEAHACSGGCSPRGHLTRAVRRAVDECHQRLALLYANITSYLFQRAQSDRALSGCEWSSPDATGLHTLVWRAQEQTHDLVLKDRLILYNQQDCVAPEGMGASAALPADSEPREAQEGGLRFIEQIKTEEDRPAFGKTDLRLRTSRLSTSGRCISISTDKFISRTNPRFKNLERAQAAEQRNAIACDPISRHAQGGQMPLLPGSNLSRDYTNFHARHTLDLRISPVASSDGLSAISPLPSVP